MPHVFEKVLIKRPLLVLFEDFLKYLKLSLTREPVERSTKNRRYITTTVIQPTQDSSKVILSVPPIFYSHHKTSIYYKSDCIPLFGILFQYPYRNQNDSMLETLIVATLTSRIDIWNDKTLYPNKIGFSLEELLGLSSLSDTDPFKQTFYKKMNKDIQDTVFPILEVDAFESLEDLKLTMTLPSLKKHLRTRPVDVSLLESSKHLIIDFTKNRSRKGGEVLGIDVLVNLKNNDVKVKSLVIAFQTRDVNDATQSSHFILHDGFVKTLDTLKELFPKKAFHHLVLFVSPRGRGDVVGFIKEIQNGGQNREVNKKDKNYSRDIFAIGTQELTSGDKNTEAFAAFLPIYYTRAL